MIEIVNEITFLLVFGAAGLYLTKLVGLPEIPGYILGGVAAGFFVTEPTAVTLAQFGLATIVFVFGLKMDPTRISKVAGKATEVSVFQILVVGAFAGFTGIILGLEEVELAFFVVSAVLSSSLVGLELLDRVRNKNLVHGRLTDSIHLVQDLIGLMAVLLVSASAYNFLTVTETLGYGLMMLTIALVFRNYVADHLFRLAENNAEMNMLISFTTLAAFMGLADLLNISIVVGAFLAGIAVAKYPHNFEALETIEPVKDFFSALLFTSLGSLIVFPTLQTLAITAALLFLTTVVKPVVTTIALVSSNYDFRTSVLTSAGLDQVSEFSLLLAILLLSNGSISQPLFDSIVLAAAVSMPISAYAVRNTEKAIKLWGFLGFDTEEGSSIESKTPAGLQDHFVILGFDDQGKAVAEFLDSKNRQLVVIENDPVKIDELRERGFNYVWGNALSLKTWKKAGADKSTAIISTVPFDSTSEFVLENFEDPAVFLRPETPGSALEFLEKGATLVQMPRLAAESKLEDYLHGILRDDEYRERLRNREMQELKEILSE